MAITTTSSLTQEFVDMLSAELIVEPDPQYVFAVLAGAARAGAMDFGAQGVSGVSGNMQAAMGAGMGSVRYLDPRWMSIAADFAKVVSEPATPGKVILVDQPRYLGGTFTETSRRLTEGTAVSATPQAATMGQVTVTIREYGGPHDGTNVAPIGITEFLKRRAKHDLVQYVGTLLRRDRNKFVDHVVSDLLLTTTHVTTPGDVAEGSLTAGAKLTEDELSEMLRKLQERNIPTFSNGLFMAVLSPKHLEDLKADSKFRESVRYLGTEGALVQGHVANHGGFMIVVSSNIPTAGVGAGSAVTGYRGVAFGPGAIGHAIGMDAEARRSKNDDFGREDRVLWLAHEGWALLDSDFVQRFTST